MGQSFRGERSTGRPKRESGSQRAQEREQGTHRDRRHRIETARLQERQSHADMVAPRLVLWAKGLPSLSLRVLGCRTGVTEAPGGWAPAERPGRCGVRRHAQGLRKGMCHPFSFLLSRHCRRASGFLGARLCSRPQGRSVGPQANPLALGAPLPGLQLLSGQVWAQPQPWAAGPSLGRGPGLQPPARPLTPRSPKIKRAKYSFLSLPSSRKTGLDG